MGTTLASRSQPESPTHSSDLTEREVVVLARCVIKVGYVCTIYFPHHHDAESHRQHQLYHEQNAKVIRIRKKGSVDLELTTGPAKGTISKNVNPGNLFFWGPFVSKTDVG